MANWFARNAAAVGGWQAGNQTVVAGPSLSIAGSIAGTAGSGAADKLIPATLTASATLQDSLGNPMPAGLVVVVMEEIGNSWNEVAEISIGANGLVSYTNTLLPPHPNYIFVVPRQTGNLIETVVTPAITPI